MSKGTRGRVARDMLEQMYGKWWEQSNIDILDSYLEEIKSMPVKKNIEKHIKAGMFFRVLARKNLLSNQKDNVQR
jgi:hypothetical protein